MDNKKILIVEDEVVLAEVLGDVLGGKGYDVEIVEDGGKALERLSEYRPGIILLDILMPKMSGIEVLREIQKTKAKDIPVIVITNLPGKENVIKEIDKDAHYFFKAEYGLREIAEKVDEIIKEIEQPSE